MCIGRENLAVPATVLCMKRISECLGRDFLWMDQDGIGITVYLNQLVRRTGAELKQQKFYAFLITDDLRIDPGQAQVLATEILLAEEGRYDFTMPVPIRRDNDGKTGASVTEFRSNLTDARGNAFSMEEARKLKYYSRHGVDFWGSSVAGYYGVFDTLYTFHSDDLADESYYFIRDQEKDVRLLPDIKVGHYKKVFLE